MSARLFMVVHITPVLGSERVRGMCGGCMAAIDADNPPAGFAEIDLTEGEEQWALSTLLCGACMAEGPDRAYGRIAASMGEFLGGNFAETKRGIHAPVLAD